jgi:IS30 family transposase
MGKKYRQLTHEKRLVIFQLREAGKKQEAIAKALGVDKGSISRELKRNSLGGVYDPDAAHNRARGRRCKVGTKIGRSKGLQHLIEQHLAMGHSPEVIAGRLKREQCPTTISHESIYKWIYGEGRALGLHHYLVRKKRKRGFRASRSPGSAILNRVSIHERPASARTDFGHWEGDSLIFKGHKGALITLYEKQSKLTLARKVDKRTAANTKEALRSMLSTIPKVARKSATFDNGLEFAHHEGVKPLLTDRIYFCDPRSPWQKGGVENANGVIRRDIPKGSVAKDFSQHDIDLILFHINDTPRKSLNFYTPIEIFSALCSQSEPVIYPQFNLVALQI